MANGTLIRDMTDSHDISRFLLPNIVPDQITESAFHVVENNDIDSEDECNHLVSLIYEYPEHQYYLYVKKGHPINEWIK